MNYSGQIQLWNFTHTLAKVSFHRHKTVLLNDLTEQTRNPGCLSIWRAEQGKDINRRMVKPLQQAKTAWFIKGINTWKIPVEIWKTRSGFHIPTKKALIQHARCCTFSRWMTTKKYLFVGFLGIYKSFRFEIWCQFCDRIWSKRLVGIDTILMFFDPNF